jgi:hypothetical protein
MTLDGSSGTNNANNSTVKSYLDSAVGTAQSVLGSLTGSSADKVRFLFFLFLFVSFCVMFSVTTPLGGVFFPFLPGSAVLLFCITSFLYFYIRSLFFYFPCWFFFSSHFLPLPLFLFLLFLFDDGPNGGDEKRRGEESVRRKKNQKKNQQQR